MGAWGLPSAHCYRTYKSEHSFSSRVSKHRVRYRCALALNIGLVAVFRSLLCSGQIRGDLVEKVGQLVLIN